tara:strand:- start:220 stop:1311 length:1092 start_codon:yes stop_codon:yes gene_type:complete
MLSKLISSKISKISKMTKFMSTRKAKIIDVHTHMYYPNYVNILKNRKNIPKIINVEGQDRLVILPNEDNTGRPIGKEYWDVNSKIKFMDSHNIDISIISLANPWLDFLSNDENPEGTSNTLNKDLNNMCTDSNGRLYGYGILPMNSITSGLNELKNISKLEHLRGIIIGTSGYGKGLDDINMEPIYQELEKNQLILFVHPHYGISGENLSKYGHSLELALGFPFETSISISKLILSGVLDRYPNLKVLVSHSGGTLPYLSGRLDSCFKYETNLAESLKKKPSDYLKDLYYDAIIYNDDCLELLVKSVGNDKIMFGTDHPFFPPINNNDNSWKSTTKIQNIITNLENKTSNKIFFENAKNLFNL